ncbi:glycoside hydrolase family 3 C-terminal domain-containing protein [bacterium]|nr:glycoside hydrolase family 3 C-terminal domain-containing protein [bacterium]
MFILLLAVLFFSMVAGHANHTYYLPPDVVKKEIYHDTWIDFNKNGIMDPYENPKLPIEQRVEDLLKRMTFEEKIYQLQSGGDLPVGNLTCVTRGFLPREGAIKANQYQRRAIEETRLGIPVIIHDEALHGIVARGCTSFPQAIGLAGTWDPELMYRVAKIIGKETRTRGIHQVLSPVVNIARDVRAGRTEETYGEDPYLTGMMGYAFCKALREEGVIATPKHYAANFVGDGGRDSNEIHFSERILREIYFPGFHSCFKAGALSVMSAYNSIDGIPCSSNNWLLNEVLKWEWGFPGFVVSDYGAAAGVFHSHHVASTLEEAAKLCLMGGLDVELPGVYIYGNPLINALKEGLVPQKALDEAVRRVLRAKFLIGLFDRPYANPDEAGAYCGSMENAQLALEAARKAIVLLKNDGNLLPLDRNKIKRIAVIGPAADSVRLGGYSGEPPRGVSPLEGIKNAVKPGTEVVFVRGCNIEINKVYFNSIPSKYFRTPDGEEGLRAEYFSNPYLDGSPTLIRIDQNIDFDWGTGAPAPNFPSENFSVRWTGKLIPPETRTYEIYARTDDGVRLWIDDQLLIDTWHDRAASTDRARIRLEAGKEYNIKMEYYEHSGFAVAQLGWDYGKKELPSGIYEAAEAARNSDVAVVFVGIVEGEGQDRANINLPGFQEELIKEVVKTGTPTVVVIIAGSAVTGDWIDEVPAILMAWYPGQEGGTAIAETLFGDNNPGGKLPITWPRYVGQLPLYYNFKPTGRGYDYVDMPGSPLFPFGHGLSYTKFEYSNLKINANENTGNVEISFEIKNTGDRTGDEVAQLYIHDVIASVARPVKELKRFKRVTLAPGESTTIKFSLTPDDLAFYDINMQKVVEPGDFEVMVGSSSADIRLSGKFNVKRTIRTSFECSLLTPEKTKAKAGEQLPILLLVNNKGPISDLCPVALYLNGKLVESHKLDLDPRERRTVVFRVDFPKPGKYEVQVGIPGQMKKVIVEVTK